MELTRDNAAVITPKDRPTLFAEAQRAFSTLTGSPPYYLIIIDTYDTFGSLESFKVLLPTLPRSPNYLYLFYNTTYQFKNAFPNVEYDAEPSESMETAIRFHEDNNLSRQHEQPR